MVSRNFLVVVALAMGMATTTYADIESDTLLARGGWAVDINHDTSDGSMFCDAYTENGAGQSFSIVAYDFGGLGLHVWDPTWSISTKSLRFLVDIDYDRWTMHGDGEGSSVFVAMNEPDKVDSFMGQLARGTAVAIYNDAERRLATFTLRGSSAALGALIECWARIYSGGDPFTSTSDPF